MVSTYKMTQPLVSSSPKKRKGSLACWLLLIAYPLLNSLGTIPVVRGVMSLEFVFSLLCVAVVVFELFIGRLSISKCNGYFMFGITLWLGTNVLSYAINGGDEAGNFVFRMLLKAFFGYMTFVVLMSTNKLNWLLWAYVAGCVICGLFTIAFVLQEGNLNSLQVMSYVTRDESDTRVNIFGGIARMGASNLLPLWICIALYTGEQSRFRNKLLLVFMPYLALLSLMALRREVLVESAVGLIVLFFAVPGKYRVMVGAAGIVLAVCIATVISLSVSWQDRLFNETRDQFETGTDPRTLLLLNTPSELMLSPLIGHGPTSYAGRMDKYFNYSADSPQLGAHNSFSRAAVETGALGLLGFIVMVVSVGWRSLLAARRGEMSSGYLRLVCIMIFLHLGDWLTFGDGIGSNMCWYFIGVLLYLDRCQKFNISGAKLQSSIRMKYSGNPT